MGTEEFDAVVIGAGVAGLYQLIRLRRLGMSVRVLEAGDGVGGTWYWNRYPGCRFDSESWTYGYFFDPDLLDEWHWSEHFAPQPETLRYLNHVADRFDLRRDITFEARVASAHWDDDATRWTVTTTDGHSYRSQFLVTAIGALSTPIMPNIPGVDRFRGESHHTARWPHEPVSFEGKRVGVIGTGATGVQTIQEVAKTAGHLTVFQRNPNWCAPLHNRPITDDEQAQIREDYEQIMERCRQNYGGFVHETDKRNAVDVDEAEREAVFQRLYDSPGFGIWMGNFRDVLVNEESNRLMSDFLARKIRERVQDPDTAERLTPRNHGFGTRRVPLETNYYEVYNQDNVRLVDLRDTPITEITETGVRTTDGLVELDMIVYATGFDAVTGAFDRIDIRGVDGERLTDHWANGPRTYLGLNIPGFPNLFTIVGPHNAATFCNMTRCIEQNVEWVSDLLAHMQANGQERVVSTPEAEQAWTDHVFESGEKLLFTKVDSWFMGVNKNLEGRTEKRFVLYAGGAPQYRSRCDEVAEDDYRGFVLQ